MTTTKIPSANPKTRSAPVRQPSPYHRLDALLHTMHCITQYEDALCELSRELKGSGVLSEEASDELRDILEQIPSHDYLIDLESVRAILAEPRPSKRLSLKKAAKSTPVHKGSAALKKKSGRKLSR